MFGKKYENKRLIFWDTVPTMETCLRPNGGDEEAESSTEWWPLAVIELDAEQCPKLKAGTKLTDYVYGICPYQALTDDPPAWGINRTNVIWDIADLQDYD